MSGPQLRTRALAAYRALLREAKRMPTDNRVQFIKDRVRRSTA